MRSAPDAAKRYIWLGSARLQLQNNCLNRNRTPLPHEMHYARSKTLHALHRPIPHIPRIIYMTYVTYIA